MKPIDTKYGRFVCGNIQIPRMAPREKDPLSTVQDFKYEGERVDEEYNHGSPSPAIEKPYKPQLVWPSIVVTISLCPATLYGVYLAFVEASWLTNVWAFLLFEACGLSITVGAHRLWAHRSYKAKWPLKLLLVVIEPLAFQKSIFTWCREHRSHHKYSDTNADPHNSKRGFFFSHMGWLLVRKHPDVIEKGRKIDLSDLKEDPFVYYQWKYFYWLVLVFGVLLPVLVPVYFWNESLRCGFFVPGVLRTVLSLQATFLVNSVAHMWGNKPYDRYIKPVENIGVAILTMGEGWHNYHHTFPWDYRASELKWFGTNQTTALINFFAKLGWAYDLKTPSLDVVKRRVKKTGDESHPVWGWGDKDLPLEIKQKVVTVHEKKKN